MFWIHGGALSGGESDDYDPTPARPAGRVVVTINYRLGWLGFLAHPALSAESPYRGSGDYGFMDQQAALRWVKRNIAKFGGDRGNVTIFGQSAGGQSVHVQLASPLAAGLFQRAIAQSGAYADNLPSLSQAREPTAASIARHGRLARPDRGVLAVGPGRQSARDAAGRRTPDRAERGRIGADAESRGRRSRAGSSTACRSIEGSTHDEFRSYAATLVPNVPADPLSARRAGVRLDSRHEREPGGHRQAVPDRRLQRGRAARRRRRSGPIALGRAPAAATARRSRSSCQHMRTSSPTRTRRTVLAPPVADFPFGAYHASELPSLFDSTTLGGHAPLTPDQEQLAAAMVRYWTQFAATGDPNSAATPDWPAYTAANDTYQSLVPPTPHPRRASPPTTSARSGTRTSELDRSGLHVGHGARAGA